MKKLLSILLLLCIILSLLTSCGDSNRRVDSNDDSNQKPPGNNQTVDLFACVYTDEDYTELLNAISDFQETAVNGKNGTKLEKAIKTVEERMEYMSTQYSIATVIYYAEQTDEATKLYDTMEDYSTKALTSYYKACANILKSDSLYKDTVFEDWTDKELEILAQFNPNAYEKQSNKLNDILMQFLELDDGLYNWGSNVYNLYVSHVQCATELAGAWGYDNYYDYMSEIEYGREYTSADREKFREYVKEYIVPLYYSFIQAIYNSDFSSGSYNDFESLYSDSYLDLDFNYVRDFIDTFDGSINEKMLSLFEGNRIKYGDENSIEGAFTMQLNYYDDAVCFFSPTYLNCSTVVHEMGHYVSFFNYDSATVSLDFLETHSQGAEWLFMHYLEEKVNKSTYDLYFINAVYMALDTIIRCAIIDEFEETVYKAAIPYSADDFDDLLKQISMKYGTNLYDNLRINDYIKHIMIRSPIYYLSYATSAVASVEFYLIAEDKGYEEAKESYRKLQEGNPDEDLIYNLEYAGLSNPFKEETFIKLYSSLSKFAVPIK